MIRPTMSHAVNKDDLHELMSKYATYLEQELKNRTEALASMFWFYNASGDKYPLAQDALNKFAVEQQIKGVKWFSENYCDDEHAFIADKAIEKLQAQGEGK